MTRGAAGRIALWVLATAGTVLLCALVAGPLHRVLAAQGWRRGDEFASTFRRVLVIGLVALVAVGLRPWRGAPADLWGLRGPTARPALFPVGLALALALMGVLVAFHAASGWLSWERRAAEKLAARWPGSVATALVVALVEETFFRGWVLSRFLARAPAVGAALATSVVYALPHGFRGSAAPRGLTPDLFGALEALRAWGASMGDLAAFGPKVLGFTAFGMLLAAARLRSGTLWLGIGIHAGAVFLLEAYGALTVRTPSYNWAGSKFLHDGLPAWLLVAAATWALWPRRR